jgi:hypothetical protein
MTSDFELEKPVNSTNGTTNGTLKGSALTLDQARRYARHIILP